MQGTRTVTLENDPLLQSVPSRDGFKVLGTSILLTEVGRGGFGAVYRAHDAKFDLEVGVKCLLPPESEWKEQTQQRFVREARLAVQLNHQNLVRVHDVGQIGDVDYLVMEFVVGETARERVARRGPLRVDEALSIALAVARGLGVAHGAGIVHRDMKPDNVMISTKGEVKVADLGLGKALGDLSEATLTAPDLAMGTPRYMPPEQWESLSAVGYPGDVWAVGATLHFLLTGQDAFQGAPTEIMRQVCDADFPDTTGMREDVPDAVRNLIRRCTARDPGDRIPDGNALAEAIEAVMAELELQPRVAPDSEAGAGTRRTIVVTPPPRELVRKLRVQIGVQPESPAPTRRTGWIVAALMVVALAIWGAKHLFDEKGDAPPETGEAAEEGDSDGTDGADDTGPSSSEPAPPRDVPASAPGPFLGFTAWGRNDAGAFEYRHDATGLFFIHVDGGSYAIGSAENDPASFSDEHPVHRVELAPFLLCRQEIDQATWARFMDEDPSPTKDPTLPVHAVSWRDCKVFLRATGLLLPTEAQWEAAAREGQRPVQASALGERAWYDANASSVQPVGTRRCDGLGFFDLQGNVSEWCEDVYAPYSTLPAPRTGERQTLMSLHIGEPAEPRRRALRGGAFSDNSVGVRIAHRLSHPEDDARPTIGFRPAWIPPER